MIGIHPPLSFSGVDLSTGWAAEDVFGDTSPRAPYVYRQDAEVPDLDHRVAYVLLAIVKKHLCLGTVLYTLLRVFSVTFVFTVNSTPNKLICVIRQATVWLRGYAYCSDRASITACVVNKSVFP